VRVRRLCTIYLVVHALSSITSHLLFLNSRCEVYIRERKQAITVYGKIPRTQIIHASEWDRHFVCTSPEGEHGR
jgi:hypothetical protein